MLLLKLSGRLGQGIRENLKQNWFLAFFQLTIHRMASKHFCMKGAFAILSICFPLYVQAQKTLEISGRVVDASNNKPVPFASVFIDRTTFAVTADSVGNFHLSIPNNQS